MIQTVDNFIKEYQPFEAKNKKIEISKDYYFEYTTQSDIKNNLFITLKDFKANSNNKIFDFDTTKNRDDEIIISINNYKKEDGTIYHNIQTGNYIGNFTYNNIKIDIKSRFSDTFLKRMLNFANDVFLDDVDVAGETKNKSDYSKFIIYYMFVQKFEKAFLLGLPKAYTTLHHHDMKLKGKIDINSFIKKDIPFKGKISSKSREQKEMQEVIDVLYKTVSIIEKEMPNFLKNITHIKTHLEQYRSKNFVSNQTIQKALNSKALLNPIFAPYKKILEYAKMIINLGSLEQKNDAKDSTYGFLVNVAELFEIYLYKLLQNNFSDWSVIHEEELVVYETNFYARKMYPDVVMKKDDKVVVFDAKYKRMNFEKGIGDGGRGDVDRTDFFQIHTYMTYYKNQGYKVLAGGLLYPMEGDFKQDKCHSQDWLGDKNTKFIIDGIVLCEDLGKEKVVEREERFIERIKEIIKDSDE